MGNTRLTKVITLLVWTCAVSICPAQRSINDRWEGSMIREGDALSVGADFYMSAKGMQGTFDSPEQRALGIPLRNLTYTAPKIHFELVGDATTIIFDGILNGDRIAGEFRENEAKGTFLLQRAQREPLPYRTEEITFRNGPVVLSGTLLLPLAKVPHPAIVFTHGSGGETRSASRFLADQFARHNIAALIYDKRGVGKSTGNGMQANFEDLSNDVIAGIHFLQTRREIDSRHIGIYGHSQGGAIAPLIASRSKDVAYIIAAAAMGVPVYEQDLYRVANEIRNAGFSEEETTKAMAFYKLWLNVARTGEGWDQVDATIPNARDEKWYPLVTPPPRGSWIWSWYRQIGNYYSVPYWEKVVVPVLLVYGERDLNTPVASSVSHIDKALRKAGNRDFTIIELPRAGHNLNIAPEAGQPFEWSRLAPGFVSLMTAWVIQRTKK